MGRRWRKGERGRERGREEGEQEAEMEGKQTEQGRIVGETFTFVPVLRGVREQRG